MTLWCIILHIALKLPELGMRYTRCVKSKGVKAISHKLRFSVRSLLKLIAKEAVMQLRGYMEEQRAIYGFSSRQYLSETIDDYMCSRLDESNI